MQVKNGLSSLSPIQVLYEFPANRLLKSGLEILNNQQGAWGCDYIYNCVEVCPKHIRPTDAFVDIRRKLVFKFFRMLGF